MTSTDDKFSKDPPEKITDKDFLLRDSKLNIIKALEESTKHINILFREVQKHANRSFAWSLILSISGFVILGVVILYYLLSGNTNNWIIIAGAIPSIIVEIVGGTLFILHSRYINQIYYFGERLTKIYETLIADYISEGIINEDKRDETKQRIAIETVTRKLSQATEEIIEKSRSANPVKKPRPAEKEPGA